MAGLRKPHAAIAHVGGLSDPSKMPCLCYGTPSAECKLGALLKQLPGTVCSKCYADRGQYQFDNVQLALYRRHATLMQALSSPLAEAEWISAWVEIFNYRLQQTERALSRTGNLPADDGHFFRWHDSGDIQSADHLRILCAIAENCPLVAFWLPTREVGFVAQYLRTGGVVPPNICVRMSVARINQSASGLMRKLCAEYEQLAISSVHGGAVPEGFQECAAYTQDGFCNSAENGNCRECWNDTADVSYPLH